ncbi:MAG: S-methyl-5'-thioadenosine phosphorylase [Bacteriovoracaceae bacterium]|jgi:5'-methylthioadenosine phosphorylase|nr:S-methyl-5'-thioadenosine phosphorylase [Halobacteriovoraceae bacterium]MDP7321238.1 S-methyl-5'-thioadenosine phosphorylase [Bacteriovoracaceae bacterium]
MKKIAVIGGSGIYNIDSFVEIQEHYVETPFGAPSSNVVEIELDGVRFYFLPRHGKGHKLSPSDINYRANIYALKMLGVDTVISISAVGSLKDDHAPKSFVIPSQFIDWTKGLRARTFFGEGVVGHVSTAYPVERALQERIADELSKTNIPYSVGGSYVCIEGPQFSSKAESEIYRSFGADVIGMTNVPEAYLAKEAGMAYATVAMVTDYDCWKEEHCSVEEIMQVMKENYESAQLLLKNLIPSLGRNPISFEPENKHAVVTNPNIISKENQEIIDMLTN